MLVLSRRVGESFVIGDKIIVTVVRIAGGGVRLGIDAPGDCVVVRKELAGQASAMPLTARSSGDGDERELP
jgi:carbon storage regulator